MVASGRCASRDARAPLVYQNATTATSFALQQSRVLRGPSDAALRPLPPMHSPPHPGALVREDVLKPHDLTVTRTADILGVSRP